MTDLYDPVSMPPRLAKAHEALDRAVDRCYRKDPFLTDRQRVEYLFALYEQLTAPLAVVKKTKRPGAKARPQARLCGGVLHRGSAEAVFGSRKRAVGWIGDGL